MGCDGKLVITKKILLGSPVPMWQAGTPGMYTNPTLTARLKTGGDWV